MLSSISLSSVFFWIAVASTLLFILKLIIFFFTGGDSELSFDFDSVTETDTSFNFLSVESVLTFFMGLGWIGLAFYSVFFMPVWMCFFAGIMFGLLFACLYAFLMINIKKLDQKSGVKIEECVGAEGKAYVNIPPRAEGRAELTINSKLSVVKVFNDTDEQIASFTPVVVNRTDDNKLYIVKK